MRHLQCIWICPHNDLIDRFLCADRTRLANVQCGGGQTVIEANNSVELLTGISVNVTTTNDDGTVTYQILEIDYKRLRGVCIYLEVCAYLQ